MLTFNIKYDKGKVEGIDLKLINNVYVNNTKYYIFTKYGGFYGRNKNRPCDGRSH